METNNTAAATEQPKGEAKPEPVTALFAAAMLKWVAPVRAIDDPRYYLQGVLIEPAPQGGVFIVATNGHVLLSAYDATGTVSRRCVVRVTPALLSACHGVPNYTGRALKGVRITVENNRLKVLDQNEAELFILPGNCLVEGGEHFPDWKKVANIHRSNITPAQSTIDSRFLNLLVKNLPRNMTERPVIQMWSKQGPGEAERKMMFVEFTSMPLIGLISPIYWAGSENFWLDRPFPQSETVPEQSAQAEEKQAA